jgi:hypothetical protein
VEEGTERSRNRVSKKYRKEGREKEKKTGNKVQLRKV